MYGSLAVWSNSQNDRLRVGEREFEPRSQVECASVFLHFVRFFFLTSFCLYFFFPSFQAGISSWFSFFCSCFLPLEPIFFFGLAFAASFVLFVLFVPGTPIPGRGISAAFLRY